MKDNDITRAFIGYRDILTKVAARFVQPGDIEDIVQETFLKIYQVDQKKAIKHPKSFMFKTAKNLALDHLKKSENRLSDSYENYDLASFVECVADETFERIEFEEQFSLFCKSVRNLPLQCRRAFILKKVYGLTQSEIAEYMDISISTVEKHLAQALLRSNEYLATIYQNRTGKMKTFKPGEQTKGVRS